MTEDPNESSDISSDEPSSSEEEKPQAVYDVLDSLRDQSSQVYDLDQELGKEEILDRQSDRGLRKVWAQRFFWLLGLQLLAMNGVFISVGLSWLQYQQKWVLELYLAGTLTEVFGIVLVITKNLFPEKG